MKDVKQDKKRRKELKQKISKQISDVVGNKIKEDLVGYKSCIDTINKYNNDSPIFYNSMQTMSLLGFNMLSAYIELLESSFDSTSKEYNNSDVVSYRNLVINELANKYCPELIIKFKELDK